MKDAKGNYPPEGDKRLTINISRELHLKLKTVATIAETTMGELIEKFTKGPLDEMIKKGLK